MSFKPVSSKIIDMSMKIICEYELTRKSGYMISEKFLYSKGLPKTVDAVQVCETLNAMGLVEYRLDPRDNCKYITITDRGKRYFQDKDEKKRSFRHDWRIAIFSAISGALLSEPLWACLRWLIKHLLG